MSAKRHARTLRRVVLSLAGGMVMLGVSTTIVACKDVSKAKTTTTTTVETPDAKTTTTETIKTKTEVEKK